MVEPLPPTLHNGKHAGQPLTKVPASYLKWMISVNHELSTQAEAELSRRGHIVPTIDVSGHAIDSASLRLLGLWKRECYGKLGLSSWLITRAEDAIEHGRRRGEDKITHRGIVFVFHFDGKWPVLKTVYLHRGGRK